MPITRTVLGTTLVALLAGCDSRGALAPEPEAEALLVGAGDIASCSSSGDEATAALVAGLHGTVVTLGDNAYEDGSQRDYRECYQPSWGAFKSRTHPAAGNHEYVSAGAVPYFDYFGSAAGRRDEGYYGYTAGPWHVVVLNSNFEGVDDEAQEAWLRADLASHAERCTLAYFHHPRFSSGEHGDQYQVWPLWEILYDGGVDLVLSGHDHGYERFAPQTPNGDLDPERGIRELVVGTGGDELRPFVNVRPNSEMRFNETFGVIRLALRPDGYGWEFLAVPDAHVVDSGEDDCH